MVIRTSFLIFAACMLSHCMIWRMPSPEDREQALALIDQGVIYLRQGDLEQAETTFLLSQEIYDLAAATDGLGCVAFLRGDLSSAEKYFNQAISQDFSYIEAYGNLALLYEQRKEIQRAEAQYRKAIELDPQNYRVRNNYAIFLAGQGESRSGSAKAQLFKASLLQQEPIIENNMYSLTGQGVEQ